MDMENLQNLIPSVLYFVDRRCFPEWQIGKQKINFQDLTFVIDGKSNYYVDGVKYTLEAGDVIYIPVGSIREAHTFKECPMHSYAFNFNWLPKGDPFALPLETVTKNVITSEMLGYIKQFKQVWMGRPPGYVMCARALFMLIIHRLLTNSYRKAAHIQADQRVNKVLDYITAHFQEELEFAEIAQIVNLHPVYLGKLIKKNTNFTFKEYLNLVRVNHAEMLLSSGGFSVTEVAERCGYHDISYFSNVFKSIKGYPPSTVLK